jgi:hypothetical protein
MSLYAYINIPEFASYCVIQEEYGVIYDTEPSQKEFLKNIGTVAIVSERDPQIRFYGDEYFWLKIKEGWCVKYRFTGFKTN